LKETPACIFCDGTPTTIEDLWPKWVGKYLGRRHIRTVKGGGGKVEGPTRVFKGMSNVAKAKVVCRECNGGWMHDLEDAASPILKRMFDETLTIQLPRSDDAARRALSKWIFKTALMIQYEQHQGSVVPMHIYREFAVRQELPKRCVIFLVRHTVGRMPNGAHSFNWTVEHLGPSGEVDLKGEMYGVTFFINNLGMQVVDFDTPFSFNAKFPQTFEHYVQRLWPPGYPVTWPDTNSLTDAELVRFARELRDITSSDPFGLIPRKPRAR
jgi:hypothetical protein